MKKLKNNKSNNVKPVGVATFGDQKYYLKKAAGITLIALIITVIVMLLLVGVTVNVALNGGLFDTAKEARAKTEKQTILEQLIGMAEYDSSGYINIPATAEVIKIAFGDNITLSPEIGSITDTTSEATITIKGKYGTYSYKVTKTEITTVQVKEEPSDNDFEMSISAYRNAEGIIELTVEANAGQVLSKTTTFSSGYDALNYMAGKYRTFWRKCCFRFNSFPLRWRSCC